MSLLFPSQKDGMNGHHEYHGLDMCFIWIQHVLKSTYPHTVSSYEEGLTHEAFVCYNPFGASATAYQRPRKGRFGYGYENGSAVCALPRIVQPTSKYDGYIRTSHSMRYRHKKRVQIDQHC